MKLSNVAIAVQKSVKVLIAIIVLYYVAILIIIPVATNIYKATFPQKTLPNNLYGQIEPMTFASERISNNNPVYKLNTSNGRLPVGFPNQVYIYRERTPQFSYEAGKIAQADAAVLGYSDADLASDLKGSTYRWLNKSTQGYLQIQVQNKSMVSSTPMLAKASSYTPGVLKADTAVNMAKNILTKIDRFTDQTYIDGTYTEVLGRVTDAGIFQTLAPEEVEVARIDFFRTVGLSSFNNKPYPILGPDAKKGLLHIVVGNTSTPTITTDRNPFVEAYYKEIETETKATYPIIPVDSAWNEVSAGKGVFSNITPKDSNPFVDYQPVRVDNILVNYVYLAYYEDPVFHKYLYPIYVFEGNYTAADGGEGSITIYYPALAPEAMVQPAQSTASAPKPSLAQ